MKDAEFQKLVEVSWQRPLSPEEEAQLNAWLLDHAELQVVWEEESGLRALLQHMPEVPPVSSNFTARVMDAVDRDARHPRVSRSLWRFYLPRLAGAALVVATVVMGVRYMSPPQDPLLEEVRMVGVIADIPNAEMLQDFEVIQELPLPSLIDKVDMELLAALE